MEVITNKKAKNDLGISSPDDFAFIIVNRFRRLSVCLLSDRPLRHQKDAHRCDNSVHIVLKVYSVWIRAVGRHYPARRQSNATICVLTVQLREDITTPLLVNFT